MFLSNFDPVDCRNISYSFLAVFFGFVFFLFLSGVQQLVKVNVHWEPIIWQGTSQAFNVSKVASDLKYPSHPLRRWDLHKQKLILAIRKCILWSNCLIFLFIKFDLEQWDIAHIKLLAHLACLWLHPDSTHPTFTAHTETHTRIQGYVITVVFMSPTQDFLNKASILYKK